MGMDLSAFSNDDLLALRNKDLSKISNQGLMLLRNSSDPTIPTPSTDDGRQTRELGTFKRGINSLADTLSFGASKPYKERVTEEEVAEESALNVGRAIGEVPVKMIGDLGALASTSLLSGGDYLGLTQDSKFGQLDVPFSTRFQEAPTYFESQEKGGIISEKGQKYYDKVNENLTALPMTATSKFTNFSKNARPSLTATVNEKIGKFVNKPFNEQLKEFTQNTKKNKIMQQSSDEGYVFIPSSTDRPAAFERLKESSIGTGKAVELAQETNQKVTNNLIRKYLGVKYDIPLNLELTEKIRKLNGKVYGQIDDLPARPPVTKTVEKTTNTFPFVSNIVSDTENVVTKQYRNGREILEDLKDTRLRSQNYWSEYKQQRTVSARDNAILLEKKAEKLEDELIDIAKYNNKPELIPELKEARKQIAKAHLVQKALNDVSGDVDAKVISKLAYDKKLVDPNIKKVAQMYKGFPSLTKIPKVSSPSPFSVLDVGLSGYGFATGNPALGIPIIGKIMAAKSLGLGVNSRKIINRQLSRPIPEFQPNLIGSTRNAQGTLGLLRFPKLTPSQNTLDASITSLLGPRILEEE